MAHILRQHSTPNPNCIEKNPTHKTVLFGDTFIHISHIAKVTEINQATVSRIFSGTRRPTLDHALAISRCLGINSTDEFLIALHNHVEGLRRSKVETARTFVA